MGLIRKTKIAAIAKPAAKGIPGAPNSAYSSQFDHDMVVQHLAKKSPKYKKRFLQAMKKGCSFMVCVKKAKWKKW